MNTKTPLGDWVHRPLTGIDPDLLPFWEGLRSHEFRLCRCTRCGSWWYPYTVCRHHTDAPDFDEMVWTPSSGKGSVFTKVVVEQVNDPAFAAEVPYVLAIVALDEGPHIPARLIDCNAYDIEIDTRVEVTYLDSPIAEHTLPFFRPETTTDASGSH
ncbi:Zn-ribbon domain-containing OB-fold protein [Rhodococcus sp. LB1]|uniref:Zn-ribbon domain-containing OB-fold protein n=1 Tax=Rhodococcus sp. LB1 TaxID=1807499 RepID=UPI0007968BB8|nr:OB-fold domain-containing protein [Rhodococcus sp. LB1]KXX54202.1 hypothetical protein AZG88_25080 [Rhodococcus sp. LB1]